MCGKERVGDLGKEGFGMEGSENGMDGMLGEELGWEGWGRGERKFEVAVKRQQLSLLTA